MNKQCKTLMIQGTGSGAGKSLITAALCRIFADKGLNVAPFKAQNMALNSYITFEGGEIGRAQALQAEAARIAPANDMNPILLKASGDMGSQVIVHGRVHSSMKAQEYYAFKKEAWKAVKESFGRLSAKHELLIIEGAGSPAEINLMNVDIVNMAVAKHAKAPVILVGDIDKGGVFASLYGTVKLLVRDSRYIKAFLINKFRGDPAILAPGLDMITQKTGKPVIGVLPYKHDIGLPEEDGLALQKQGSSVRGQDSAEEKIKIVILRLQYISNFTDFDPLLCEPDVELIYSRNRADILNADLVIIPGSKNTVKDLLSLKDAGLDKTILDACSKGVMIMGMCGGYQMLGKKIYDPYSIESTHKQVDGIGLLNIETTFNKTKVTCQVEAEVENDKDCPTLKGYEIHMGESSGDTGIFRLTRHGLSSPPIPDGSRNGNCWGTYIHGIFENDLFRRTTINTLRRNRGMAPIDMLANFHNIKDRAIDDLAAMVMGNMDMDLLNRILKL